KNLIDRFDEIYRRNINDASIRMDDVMFILGLYQTRATNTSVANPIYWRLYNEVLNRIDKGVWSVHPQMWSTYLKDSVDTEFSDAHRKVSMSKLDDKYIGILRN